jgi:hypothetical protein
MTTQITDRPSLRSTERSLLTNLCIGKPMNELWGYPVEIATGAAGV